MAKITRKQVDRYLQIQQEKRERRQAIDALDREQRSLESSFMKLVQAAKGLLVTCGARLEITKRRGRVSWKDAFVEELGGEPEGHPRLGAAMAKPQTIWEYDGKQVVAATKSEARAAFKRSRQLKRLPPGAVIRRVGTVSCWTWTKRRWASCSRA